MPTVELDIRQLADEGGTAPLAPITVTDAVLDEDGNTLTDMLDELKAGLTPYVQVLRAADMTFPTPLSLYNENTILVVGKIAILNISIKCVNGSGSNVILNYIPPGYRPRAKINAATETGLADGKLQPIAIGVDGSATIFPVNSGTTYVIGTVTYVLA